MRVNKQKLEETGAYYGYPKCCIESFYIRYENMSEGIDDITQEQVIASNNTGFIPCKKCAKRVVNGELELKDLIKNREHSKEFPNDRMDEK